MHVLTKVLVLFCAVMALLLSALTVAYAANADRVGDALRGVQRERDVAQNELTTQSSIWNTERTQLEETRDALQIEIRDLKGRIDNFRQVESGLRTDLEQAKATGAAAQNQIGQFSATIETQTQLLSAMRDEVNNLRDDLLEGNRREIELVDRINDLESAREVLEQTTRALREQLREAQFALERERSGVTDETASEGFVASGRVIAGTVQSVDRSEAGDTLVVLNEGTNAGVRENMMLNVVRDGNQFVASVRVVRAEPQQSVAVVTLLAEQGAQVRQGDQFRSRIDIQ